MIKKIIQKVTHTILFIIYTFINILKLLTAIFSTTIILGIIVSLILFIKIKPTLDESKNIVFEKLTRFDDNTLIPTEDTIVYDESGNELGRINVGNFEYKNIQEINPLIINSYIAVEDKRFKEHSGIDFIAILRAGLSLAKHRGKITQGGSSITQQVIKNMLLTNERSYKRKLSEMMLAPYIDVRLGKDKVMELYCNTNFYANNCYGVESASKFYFNKTNNELTPDEVALLVGLSNSPANYDPIKHKDKALEKRNKILSIMKNNNVITEDEYNNAINTEITIYGERPNKTKENYATSFALRASTIELMKNNNFKFQYTFKNKDEYDTYKNNYKEVYNHFMNDIRNGGYNITVTLDNNLQTATQQILDNNLSSFDEIDPTTQKQAFQGAIVVIENSSHSVKAIIGGRGDDEFNRAYLSVRQPGSTIKPLLDYGPAIDVGKYQENSVVNDHYEEGKPKNAGNYFGNITIKEALPRSLNTVAHSLLNDIGIDVGLSYLNKMQFKNINYIDSNSISIALGGFTNGVTVIDLAKGYETIANGGIYNDKTYISSIKFKNEELLKSEYTDTRVYDENTSYIITDMLKDVINKPYGTGYGLNVNDQIVAGKTGTTNDNKDGWFVGYSKYYTVAVWTGYDTPREMQGVYGKTYSGKIWQEVMNMLHQNLKPIDFTVPSNISIQDDFILTTDADIKLEKLNGSNNQNKEFDAITNEVINFENFNIKSVDDAIAVEPTFNNIKSKVEIINNDTIRNDLLIRISNKYDKLKIELTGWDTKIKEYQNLKTQEQQIADEKAKIENEKQRQKELEKIKIANFNNALKNLQDLNYKLDVQDFNYINNQIKNALTQLESLPSYQDYFTKYQNTLDNYNSLKTKEELLQQEKSKNNQPTTESYYIYETEYEPIYDSENIIADPSVEYTN